MLYKNHPCLQIHAIVLNYLIAKHYPQTSKRFFLNVELADICFDISSKTDTLIGADFFAESFDAGGSLLGLTI